MSRIFYIFATNYYKAQAYDAQYNTEL